MGNENAELSRRGFLAASLTCLASAGVAGLAPAVAFAQDQGKPEAEGDKKIINRTLGRTKLNLPIVSMGVMNASNPEIVQASYELGIRHFDTAAYYQFGRNEQMVGSVIKKLDARDKVIIATKVMASAQRRGLSAAEAKQKLTQLTEASLKRLDTDYVDILYLHDVSSSDDVNNPGIIEGMNELRERKLVRFFGVSTHSNMAGVITAVTKLGFHDVVLTAVNFAMSDDTALFAAIKEAAEAGVGVVAMKTQVGGSRLPNPETLKDFSGSVLATAALKWVLRNGHISTAIPGFTSFEHMREDFSVASDLDYTQAEEKLLNNSNIKLGLGFCRQCHSCLASCPHDVDVPTLMRTHMYAAQYANFYHARAVLDDIAPGRGLAACTSCTDCSAHCARTVDIPTRISELKTMYA